MTEAWILSTKEYHYIFGSSDDKSATVDCNGSDVDVQVESDQDEDENDSESNNDWNVNDTIEWSNELKDFAMDEFSGEPGMKFNIPDNPSAISFVSRL